MSLVFDKFDDTKNLSQQRELFLDCFPECKGKVTSSDQHYHWKFKSIHQEPHSYEYFCHENNKYMGYYAAIPYMYNISGKVMKAGMVCDVMTHSQARGKGVFTKLGAYSTEEFKKEGLHFTTGYPIRPEVIPGHLKVGWKVGVHLPIYLTAVSLSGILTKFKLGFLSGLLNPFVSLFHGVLGLFTLPSKDIKIKIWSLHQLLNHSGYETFFKKWSEQVPYFLIKDKDFLKWRLSAPETVYEIVVSLKEEKVIGLAIVRKVELKEIPSLAILDYMYLLEHIKSSPTLLNAIKKYAQRSQLTFVASMVSNTWAHLYKFKNAGFIKSPMIFKFITKKLNHDIDDNEFLLEKNWHLMWIDSDDL